MRRLVHEPLFESAGRFPQKIAVVCDGETTTYEELTKEIQKLSSVLHDAGLEKGNRVLLLVSHKRDYLIACYAIMAAGGVAVPLHAGCSTATIIETAGDCTPTLFVIGESDLEYYRDLPAHVSARFVVLRHDPSRQPQISYVVSDEQTVLGRTRKKTGVLTPDDDAIILYTSGTTGRRKGVVLPHSALLQASVNINAFMGIDRDIREFVSIPLTHSFGFGRVRCVFSVGGTLVFINGFMNPVSMTHTFLENDCDAVSAVPSGIAMFFGRFDHLLIRMGPRVRFVELGSAPMSTDHKLRIIELFPKAKICMHYGLTEASRSTFLDLRAEQGKLDSVGKPSPGVEVSVLDSLGVPVAVGEKGEIAVRGKHVMNRYWNNASLTGEKISRDGWFRTDDFGFMDDAGYLYLLGRKDDMINMGGIKISPLEIEESVKSLFPTVELCVVGYPDPKGVAGEIPVLCYVPRQGIPIRESELMELLANRLDRFKIPRMTVPLKELPKTNNAKIRRQEVRKLVGLRLSGSEQNE